MATQLGGSRRYVVISATRKRQWSGADVGYFKTAADVPPGFEWPHDLDITDVMVSMRLTDLDRCLTIMNQHWR